MKKTILAMTCALSVAALAVADEGKDYFAEAGHPTFVFQIGLDDPVQWPAAKYNVYGIRLDLIAPVCHDMYGIDFGFVGVTTHNLYGIALNFASIVDSDLAGLQVGLFGNVAGGSAYGVQLAGLFNYGRSIGAGFQASMVNVSSVYTGLQLGGLVNVTKNEYWGVQLGLVNVGLADTHGWSLGAVNNTSRLFGVQIGFVNLATESGNGIQLGIFNGANNYNGIQIGVLNALSNGAIEILPIFNANF